MSVQPKIKKHVAIIHAYSMMSVLQRKIFNVFLYEATKANVADLSVFNNGISESVAIESKMHLTDLKKAVKFNSNNTRYLKEAIDGLASLSIEWNLLKDRAPTNISFLNLRVLHGAPTFYVDNTVNFSFHRLMLDFIDNPSIYGTVDLDLQSQFESKYGHALYENSTRFENLNTNKIIPLESFRKILGVDDNKYLSMREFTRNVISPSVEEVNDRADFLVNLESIREGRKITGIVLHVDSKNKKTKPAQSPDVTENKILSVNSELRDSTVNLIREYFGTIHPAVIESIQKQYSQAYIHEKIDYVKKYSKKDNSGFFPPAYFIAALKGDYKQAQEGSSQSTKTTPILNTPQVLWNQQLVHLEQDFQHWNKLLEISKQNNHIAQIASNEKILKQCGERIAQHLTKRPKE